MRASRGSIGSIGSVGSGSVGSIMAFGGSKEGKASFSTTTSGWEISVLTSGLLSSGLFGSLVARDETEGVNGLVFGFCICFDEYFSECGTEGGTVSVGRTGSKFFLVTVEAVGCSLDCVNESGLATALAEGVTGSTGKVSFSEELGIGREERKACTAR